MLSISSFGVVDTVVAVNQAQPGAVIAIPSGQAITLHDVSISVFGGNSNYRVIVGKGNPPSDVTALTQTDVNNNPVNVIATLGNPIDGFVVPFNSTFSRGYGHFKGIGPYVSDGGLFVLAVPLIVGGNMTAHYVMLSAFGELGAPSGDQDQFRSIPTRYVR